MLTIIPVQPMIAVQTTLPAHLIPVALVLTRLFSPFSGGVFLSLTNSLRSLDPRYSPNIAVETVIAAGATGLSKVVPAADLPGVLLAYSKSTDHVMYLRLGAACASFVFAWGMGEKEIRANKTTSAAWS